ncbi:LysR family transcriptional regulator [Polycladidibacter hongkongensis]|uniref:LysR family transcriptional regulator n=1 Tax=Polycladidibacter hongkongensis TaxID=1647556 RepID=UPI0008342BFC|nr:LysR family transcriptional regulator [Pseudovibrio hongkongensis]
MLSADLEMLVLVADHGSFAAAAEVRSITPSAVSRKISRLEVRIGAQLLYRSTRKLTFTREGYIFLDYARQLIATAKAAKDDISQAINEVQGHLRVNCGTAYARHKLGKVLPGFLRQNPKVTIDLTVCDHRIDPFQEQVDVTIRVGHTDDCDLIAIPLGTVERIIAASPEYLDKFGVPKQAGDLDQHECLLLKGFRSQASWPIKEGNDIVMTSVKGSFTADNADILLEMALSGLGVIRVGDFLGEQAIADEKLVKLFEGRHCPEPKQISALVLPGRQKLPRIRAFIDFLKENY